MAEVKIDVEELVVALADDKLVDYLLDSDAVEQIVDWAHQDLRIPKPLLRAFFKLLAPHLLKQVQRLGGTLVGRGLNATARILARFDGYRQLVVWLGQLRQRLDQRIQDARLLDALIAGVRPARSIAEASTLSREFRASWTMMTGIEQAVGQANDLLAKLANPQPALDLPLIGSNKHTRFLYGAQRVPFIGRRAELEAIDRFLADERDFAWGLITGPAGVGKSRMALEVCLRNGVAWRAGFLPGQHGFAAWRSWQPEQPTLMIADYAAGRAADLREIMLALQSRLDLTFPVRLLLLERDVVGAWWDELARGGQEQALIEAASAGEPWRLGPMGRDDLWATMRVFFGDRAVAFEAQREQILDSLAEIDSHRRPLFAAMAADALMEGGELRGWDRTLLLRDLLKREDQRWWRPAGIGPDDPHRVWLALATVFGGMTRDELDRSEVKVLSDFRRETYELLSGRPLDSREIDGKRAHVLLPLEPDIVGELYVLDLCARDEDFLEQFRDVAWKLDAHRVPSKRGRDCRRCRAAHHCLQRAPPGLATPCRASAVARGDRGDDPRLASGFVRYRPDRGSGTTPRQLHGVRRRAGGRLARGSAGNR